ncbi:MAG: hypothetical protein ACX931_05520 [Saccharospirillum sp.]
MHVDIQVALFALAGVLSGGLIAGWFQHRAAKLTAQSDMVKLKYSRKSDLIIETVSNLLTASDPELHEKYDYEKVVSNIHKLQLLLDPKLPMEGRINLAAGEIGFAIQADLCSNDRDNKRLLSAQSELTESSRDYFRQAP